MDFWEVYVPMLMSFYWKLLSNVCEGGSDRSRCMESCWGVVTGTFHVMLDDVCKVSVHANSAHLVFDHKGMGIIVHVTLFRRNGYLRSSRWP